MDSDPWEDRGEAERRQAYEDRVRERLEEQRLEIERLRGLLDVARGGLLVAGELGLIFRAPVRFHDSILNDLRRSDPDAAKPEVEQTPWNVVVRLYVSRPESEYLPAMLAARLPWDAYAGHIRVHGVDVLYGAAPFPDGTAAEAIATLATADDGVRS